MKKVISVLLIFAMCFTMFACGGTGQPQNHDYIPNEYVSLERDYSQITSDDNTVNVKIKIDSSFNEDDASK